MKKYNTPTVEVLELDVLDVIQASGGIVSGGDGDSSDIGTGGWGEPVTASDYFG